MKIFALCWTCGSPMLHVMDFDPRIGPGAGFSDWLVKHPEGHEVDFQWPQRSQKAPSFEGRPGVMLHNADIKPSYAASSAVTITLASLAASQALLAGRESTAISNASNKYDDYHLAGHYRSGAANLQAGFIQTSVVGARNDTPAWPDVFDGTDSAETVTTAGMFNSICKVVSTIVTDATQRIWPFGPVAVGSVFGFKIPIQWVVFVSQSTHTTTNVWSATEGDHAVSITPIYYTVI